MKATKFFAMLFAFAALSFTVTSCGDDDDEINPDEIITGQTTAKFTKETKNELEITLKSAICMMVSNAKFDNNQKLTSCIIKSTWATKNMAQQYYDELECEDGVIVKIEGKTVTEDHTNSAYFKEVGADYNFIYEEFKYLVEHPDYFFGEAEEIIVDSRSR